MHDTDDRLILRVIRSYAIFVVASVVFAVATFGACFMIQNREQAQAAVAAGYVATWVTAVVFLGGLVINVCCWPDDEARTRAMQWTVVAFCTMLVTAFFMPPIVM
ncbi:MAG: hypothetical protein KF708_09735 [Pirellulales bacterium]|nr:hypothetical protein [Pirellulales bacterium]